MRENPRRGLSGSVLSLRRRTLWEAADSGILLWRENILYFIPLFAIPVWICAFCLLLIPEEARYLSWILLWWLKPFFDRLALQAVASRFFKQPEQAGWRTVLKGLGSNITRGLPGDLLWRRFGPLRGAVMPLRILERLKRGQLSARKKTLETGGLKFCAVLSALGLFIEAGLLAGEAIFCFNMAGFFLPDFSIDSINTGLFFYCAYCFNYMLVESLYVSMGFALYINCRVEMEGWDLELLFRKFAGRISAALKLLVLVSGLFLFVFPAHTRDEETDKAPKIYLPEDAMPAGKVPVEKLNEILQSKEFGGMKDGWTIAGKNKNEEEIVPELDLDPWVKQIKEAFGAALRAIVIILIAACAVFILLWLWKHRNDNRTGGKKRDGEFYANPLVTGESPESLFSKAETLFARRLIREAWAACISGVIASYTKYFGIVFPRDATEYDCLELTRSHLGGREAENSFGELVRHWVFLAYGGKSPPEGSFEKALAFGRSLKGASFG
jgi:hypothetical protein